MGHEIAYHYDVLDASRGDYQLALAQFEQHVDFFREQGFEIKTVCPHGNPLMKRVGWSSNKDFFRSEWVRRQVGDYFDVVVDWPKYFDGDSGYISDAGYRWKLISNVSENDRDDFPDKEIVDFFGVLDSKNNVVLSTHPHRWRRNKIFQLLIRYRFFLLRGVARLVGRSELIRKLITPFYGLAKRF
jgi:hypothetical protein